MTTRRSFASPGDHLRVWLTIVVVGLVAAACGGGGSGASPPTSVATAQADPSPSIAETTTVPVSTHSTGTSSPAVSVPADAPVVTADDAVLAAAAKPETLQIGGQDPCRVLTGTARLGGCAVIEGANGKLAWFASDENSPDPPVVVIYRLRGGLLKETVELSDALRPTVEPATVVSTNLDRRPGEEMVVGIRNQGTGGILQLEIIGGSGTVVGHLTVDRGRAVVGPGAIEVWEAQYGPDDPNCCPSAFAHRRIVFAEGRYRIIDEGNEPTGLVPLGQFP